ncbi:MAG: nucleotidyltransferase domain-containing protein [Gallionella sp.]|jgi:predicted nucleotidyltransferase
MRLADNEINSIRAAVSAVDPESRIYLFGSRVDDHRRGGDIDLFVESSFRIELMQRLLLEYRISSACDTRVDLLIKSPEDEDMPIHRIARKNGVRL